MKGTKASRQNNMIIFISCRQEHVIPLSVKFGALDIDVDQLRVGNFDTGRVLSRIELGPYLESCLLFCTEF